MLQEQVLNGYKHRTAPARGIGVFHLNPSGPLAGVRKEKMFFDGGKNMKRALVILVFLLLATPLWAAEVGLNISLGAPGFYLSVGNFYGYPERQVIVIHERGIPDDDIPVVFFISKHAHVAPEVIIKLRVVDGWAWSRICAYYRIPPTVPRCKTAAHQISGCVYPSIPHPSQRPEVKGGYGGEQKGRARGRGKKD